MKKEGMNLLNTWRVLMSNTYLLNNRNNKEKIKGRSGDVLLLFSVVVLSFIGLIFVYSASKYSSQITYGNPYYVATKHLVGILTGIVAIVEISAISK